MGLNTYFCDDGNCEVEIEAETAQEAAEEYVSGGDWGEQSSTNFHSISVREEGHEEWDSETITVALDPAEPDCVEGRDEHSWVTPIELVGGCKENPGVWGSGGGVKGTEICEHCGTKHHFDTWVNNPCDGSEGHTGHSYGACDSTTQEWLDGRAFTALLAATGDAESLDELLASILRVEASDYGELDTHNLPTFGGAAPEDMRGVRSWDGSRLIVANEWGECEIVGRGE